MDGNHHTPYLQHAWNKYGAEAFEFSVLEQCLCENLETREQFYIDTLKPAFNSITDVKRRAGPGLLAKRAAALRARAALITHCPRGHAYDEANTYIGNKGKRICRRCAYERNLRTFKNETPEQRAVRIERAGSYYHRNREELLEQQKTYAASRKEQKRAYDAAHAAEKAKKDRERLLTMTPEQREAKLAAYREYNRRRPDRIKENGDAVGEIDRRTS